ncbi:MAG: hypothetical protein WC623_24250 [Pedobacter sp.]|uniref:hypothetical protein n=1 Tax=Pedobacter sp. TaxID=1411316 RepID=UPI0035660182
MQNKSKFNFLDKEVNMKTGIYELILDSANAERARILEILSDLQAEITDPNTKYTTRIIKSQLVDEIIERIQEVEK